MSSDESTPERGFTLGAEESPDELPRIDFSTFVLSLAASGMLHLGMAPDPTQPDAGPGEPNLPLAQQTIDTLAMLHEKTRGNLDDAEAKLIESVLYELRMQFVRTRDGS